MITAAAWIASLIAAGFGPGQAAAIARFSAVEASPDRGVFHLDMPFDPCAHSRFGESLLGVTQGLRGELHHYTETRSGSCVAPMAQATYLAYAFPLHYPECASRFAHGDLAAFKRCWGKGRSR